MARFGRNLKLHARPTERSKIQAFFSEGLGAKVQNPRPDLEMFLLDDGFNIGVFYVDDGAALSDSEALKGPWLEILVSDVESALAKLLSLGARELDFIDKTHHYLQAPGGMVFRLAAG